MFDVVFQQAPSAYMAEMQLSTSERLKLTYEMRVPQVIELLDMSEQTLQKVPTGPLRYAVHVCRLFYILQSLNKQIFGH